MKTGICPKCGSTEIRTRCGDHGVLNLTFPRQVPIGKASYALIQDYVCISCGYLESYVTDPKSLTDLAEKWSKVDEATQPGTAPVAFGAGEF